MLLTVALLASLASLAAADVESSSTAARTSSIDVENINVASDNPDVAPVVTLTLRGTGVATLWWRAGAGDWQATTMMTGPSGLSLARLPDGVQRQGFSFFVEASGPAGAAATFASRAAPIDVAPAVEGNADRVARNARDENARRGPHPAFVMIALGTGVLAGAGAGAFGYDLAIVNNRLTETDAELATGPPSDREAALRSTRAALETAALQDTIAATTLGVVAGVAIVSGVALFTIGAVEQ